MEGNSYPDDFAYKLSKFTGFTKNIVEVFPDGDRGSYGLGTRVRFTFPAGSTVDLSDICLHFTGSVDYAQINDGTNDAIGEVRFSRDIATCISQLTLYSNGKILQQITDYNEIVNMLKDWKETSEQDEILSHTDPIYQDATVADFAPSKPTNDFVIKNWLGIMSKDASSSIIDTNIFGQMILEVVFADANQLVLNVASDHDFADSTAMMNAVSNVSATFSNLKLSMTRYNMPMEYYNTLERVLSNGKRRILFDHYELIEGTPANAGYNSVRFNINSQSINYMLGSLVPTNRKQTGKPKLVSSYTNTSSYYNRVGTGVSTQYVVGSTKLPVNAQSTTDCYVNTLRLWGCKSDGKYHHNPSIESLTTFADHFYTAPLSLEYSTNMCHRETKMMSGLSTNNLPLSITFELNAVGPINGLSPLVLVSTSRILEFDANQNSDIVI